MVQFLIRRLQASAISCSSFSVWVNSRELPTATAPGKNIYQFNLVELFLDGLP
jgi:hypothetical protein